MKPITDDAIAKVSWGILGTMALGLMTGTAFVMKLSYSDQQHTADIAELKAGQPSIQTDIAVIKSKLEAIDAKLDRIGRDDGEYADN